jgi:hypothetical protein
MKIYRLPIMLFILVWASITQGQTRPDVAMITALQGEITYTVATETHKLEPFVKLKVGDVLNITSPSNIQITYFKNGRQESWHGAGKLEITPTESHSTDLPTPQIKQIPLIIVKQIARTPSLDSQGRAGVTRVRSIATPQAIAGVEKTYKEMRTKTDYDNLDPELYFLSGMFELKQFDKVKAMLSDLIQSHPKNREVKVLLALYRKAFRDARTASSHN